MKNQLAILGLGSQSTIFYISELNCLYNKIYGGYSTCPFIILNTNFDEINALLPNSSDKLITILEKYIHQIAQYEIDYILVPNITLHQCIDKISTSPNIIHPIQLCINKLVENKIQEITLFGTRHTMQSNYILSFFAQQHIDVKIPSTQDFDFIESFRNVVYDKRETPELIDKYQCVLHKYSSQKPVVLACTELSIYNRQDINIYDMVRMQIKKAIEIVTEN